MPTNGRPFASPRSSVRGAPVHRDARRLARLRRDLQHAREVVAAAARDDREVADASAERAREGADQAVAADSHDGLAVLGGARAPRRARGRRCACRPPGTGRPGASARPRPPAARRAHVHPRRPGSRRERAGARSLGGARRHARGALGRELPARVAAEMLSLLELLDLRRRDELVARRAARRAGSRGCSGRARAGRPAARCASSSSGVMISEETSAWPGRTSQCSSKMPELVRVEPLAVREQEVEAGERRPVDARLAPASAATRADGSSRSGT